MMRTEAEIREQIERFETIEEMDCSCERCRHGRRMMIKILEWVLNEGDDHEQEAEE
jgi:NADH:ubiquinone oxidoreductase subunit F (NADH-binding)